MKYNQALTSITHRQENAQEDVPLNRKRNQSLNITKKPQILLNGTFLLYKAQKTTIQYSPRKQLRFVKLGKIYKNVTLMKRCQKNFQAYLKLQNKLIQQQQTFDNLLCKPEDKTTKGKESKLSLSQINLTMFKNETIKKAKWQIAETSSKSRIKTEYNTLNKKQNNKTFKTLNDDRPIFARHKKLRREYEQKGSFGSQQKYEQLSFKQIIGSEYELSHAFAHKLKENKLKLITYKLRNHSMENTEEIKGW